MQARDVIAIAKDAYHGWSEDEGTRLAAALAFYGIFAIAPLLIIVIEIGALMLGGAGHHHVVRDQILRELQPAIGDAGTKAVGDVIQATFNQRHAGTIASIIGWVLFALAATGLMASIEDALNTVWGVKQTGGIKTMIVDRLKSFGIIAAVAVIAVGLVAVTAAVSMIGDGMFPKIVNALIAGVIAVAMTAVLYKFLPRTSIEWRDVIAGAIFAGVLSVVGQYLIGWYLGRGATTSAFGAAGSLVAILLWMYYSAQIFLFGAEISKAYATRHGSKRGQNARAETGTIVTPRFSRASSP